MSNIASSADEYDLIETIDELDPTDEDWHRSISPFDLGDFDEVSENFALSRSSSVASVLTGNFGGARARPYEL